MCCGSFNPTEKYLLFAGWDCPDYQQTAQLAAEELGLSYRYVNLRKTINVLAPLAKHASAVLLWNGWQAHGPLVRRICEQRDIPILYIEWGLLPQKLTFSVDPMGFAGESILKHDTRWVTEIEMKNLIRKRIGLQRAYPLQPVKNRLLVLGQVCSDSQILHHTPYNNMTEFVRSVEDRYVGYDVLVRPHPKSSERIRTRRAILCDPTEPLLLQASKAEKVIGLNSTALFETAILGVPTEAMCNHPLFDLSEDLVDKILAGKLALRVIRGAPGLGKIFQRFYSLESSDETSNRPSAATASG